MAGGETRYIRVVGHRGADVVCPDFSGCKTSVEATLAVGEMAAYFRGLRPGVRCVVNVHGVPLDAKFMDRANRLGKEVFTPKIIRGAIIGVEGYKKVLLRTYNFFSGNGLVPMATMEEALDFVTQDLV